MGEVVVSGLLTGWAIAVPVGAVAALIVTLTARTSWRVGAGAALGVASVDAGYAVVAVVAETRLQAQDAADLVEHGVFTKDEYKTFQKAEAFLWNVRVRLHYLLGRAEERLFFDVQPALAAELGYVDAEKPRRAVEAFMRAYFLVAKDVGDLTRIFCAALEEQHKKPRRDLTRILPGFLRPRSQDDDFYVENGRLNANPAVFRADLANPVCVGQCQCFQGDGRELGHRMNQEVLAHVACADVNSLEGAAEVSAKGRATRGRKTTRKVQSSEAVCVGGVKYRKLSADASESRLPISISQPSATARGRRSTSFSRQALVNCREAGMARAESICTSA